MATPQDGKGMAHKGKNKNHKNIQKCCHSGNFSRKKKSK